MRKNFTKYFGHTQRNITEGGNSRNSAIIDEISKTNCEMFIFYPSNKISRIILGLNVLFKFIFYKNEKLFIHYGVLPYLFTEKLISNRVILRFVFIFIKKLDKNNKITFEINDLPYEQAIDLELPKNNLNKLDLKLFRLKNTQFVFASELMRSYVIGKYNISIKRTSVLINGAPKLLPHAGNPIKSKSEPLNLVYAGSLNRGRQIELLIEIFKNNNNNLYLLGAGGEWICDLEYLGGNIKYLGSMDEKSAHAFVAKCDIGLLPYDETRFYYNLCYPTKASFYITAGIPFISTKLKEMQLHFSDDVVMYQSICKWRDLINSDYLTVRAFEMQSNVRKISHQYEWPYLINKWMAG